MHMADIVFAKIDKKSKPIKKMEKKVHKSLQKRRINLDNEKFDIQSVLKEHLGPLPSRDEMNSTSDQIIQRDAEQND